MSAFDSLFATGINSGKRVTNAIAQASRRTGVDFNYLLGQAQVESSLNPAARASTSSAAGLYQFIDQSWLAVINQHGDQYGLGWAAQAIQQNGAGRYFVADPTLRQQIMDLRNHPETASVMAAEHAADNKAFLESRLGRAAQPVDLYLAHFLGAGGAVKFLNAMATDPGASGAAIVPAAARANRSIFYDRQGNARSLADIRNSFAAKLERGVARAGGQIDGQITTQIADAGQAMDNYQLPEGARTVQPADYVRIETARLQQNYAAVAPNADTARLAYLMLATFGR